MPASTDASVERAGDALRFAGVLSRPGIKGVWQRMPALDGVRTLDLRAVRAIDSAGLALLAEVAARAGGTGEAPQVAVDADAPPEGLADLRAAYRLDAGLQFQGA